MFFFEELAQLRGQANDLHAAGVQPVLIVQARADQLEESAGTPDGILLIPDPEHITHRSMGFQGMPPWKLLLSSKLRQARKRASSAGHRQNWSRTFGKESDALMNPGMALVGTDGCIRWIHRGEHVGDLPQTETLLKILADSLS